MTSRDEREALQHFRERYAVAATDLTAQIEASVIGAVWGANGYTTLDQADELARRCIEAPEVSRPLARRLDRALSALAPNLDALLGGSCPACGHEMTMRFDPLTYK